MPSQTKVPALSAAASVWRLARGFLARTEKVGRSWDDAHVALGSGRYSAISIDCFDTLVARLAPDWEQVSVARMAADLARQLPASAEQRIGKVRAALRARGVREPTALAIWEKFCGQTQLPLTLADKLGELERELLTASSAGSSDARKFVAQALALGVPLIVCSDTRLPAKSLSQLLHHHGFNLAEQAIVCSCDYNQSKFDGSLYTVATERIQSLIGTCISAKEILHVGDNIFSDFYSAACHGWSCVKIPAASLSPDQRTTARQAELLLQGMRDSLEAIHQ